MREPDSGGAGAHPTNEVQMARPSPPDLRRRAAESTPCVTDPEAIEGGVITAFSVRTLSTLAEVTAAFNRGSGGLFVEGRALPKWVASWLDNLIVDDRVQRTQGGFFRLKP